MRLFYRLFLTLLYWHICLYSEYSDTGPDAISDALVIDEISVTIPDPYGQKEKWIDLIRMIVPLREQTPCSDTALQQSLDVLNQSGLFQDVKVSREEQSPGMAAVSISATPYLIVKNITIRGEYPIFESEVLKIMSVRSGSPFTEEMLAEQEQLIKSLYVREGFPNVTVSATVQKRFGKGECSVAVAIKKNTYYPVGRIVFRDNRAFSGLRLKMTMGIWRSKFSPGSIKRFSDFNLKKDIDTLQAFYRKKRYYDCQLTAAITFDSTRKAIDIEVHVDEGSRYVIAFSGNRLITRRLLHKELTLAKKGNPKDMVLKRNMRKMEQLYKRRGFLHTRVSKRDTTVTVRKKKRRIITISVDEGILPLVDSIAIRGNRAFDNEKIKKQMLIQSEGRDRNRRFVEETLEKDVLAIQSLYLKNGYGDISISYDFAYLNDTKSGVAVAIDIDEGIQKHIESISFKGLSAVSDRTARKKLLLKKGKPFQRSLVKQDRIALSRLIGEKGYPHVTVDAVVNEDSNPGAVAITYDINEGEYVSMGKVFSSGNFKTRGVIFRREIKIKEGEAFSLAKMLSSQKNIANLGIINSVTVKPLGLKEKADTTHLLVDVEEKKPYSIRASIGYESENRFYSQLYLKNNNLLGFNKSLQIGGNVGFTGYRGEIQFIDPRVFGFPTVASMDLYYEHRKILGYTHEFGINTLGASAGLKRRVLRYFHSNIAVVFERRKQFGVLDSAAMASDEYKPRNIVVFIPAVSLDTRDSYVRPKRGVNSTIKFDISLGLANKLDDFIKSQWDTRWYITPFRALTLASQVRLGHLHPYGGNTTIPQDQLFFLGGTYTVRGFRENLLFRDAEGEDPEGGYTSAMGSIEARIALGKNFELATFYDMGRIANSFQIDEISEFRSSAGLGIRYITPIGPVGLLYGFKIKRKPAYEKIGRFHFSLGYTF